MFTTDLLKTYNLDFQNSFFLIFDKNVYTRSDVWEGGKIFLPKNSQCSEDLITIHGDSKYLSPKHSFLIKLFNDEFIEAFYLIFSFWTIEAFRHFIFIGVIPNLLRDFSELESEKSFIEVNTHKLQGISNSLEFKVTVPFFGTLRIKNKIELELFITKTMLIRHFIVYFHSLLRSNIFNRTILPFSDEDEALIEFSEFFFSTNTLASLDSFFSNLKKNGISTKNLLTSFLREENFCSFFLNMFNYVLKKNLQAEKIFTFDVSDAKKKLECFGEAQKYKSEFFNPEDFSFCLKMYPDFNKTGQKFFIKNFYSENTKLLHYFYGHESPKTSFLKKLVCFTRDEVVTSVS